MNIWEKLKPYLEKEHSCIVCHEQKFEIFAAQNYLSAKKCLNCGMISVNPHFNDEGLHTFYSTYFVNRQEDHLRKKQREITYLIDRDWVSLFIKEGKVLDVGCSGGFFLSKFSEKHWERYGVEITKDAAEYANSNYSIPVYVGNIVEMDIKDKFDLVMLRGVIEHFRDPVSVLKKCSELLKPGGFLFITATPAGNSFAFEVYREKWILFTPLEHIHFFSTSSLSKVLKNFDMEFITYHSQYEETPYANPNMDYQKIQQDISLIQQGKSDQINNSVPFPGSMITALWQKTQ